MDFSRFLRVAAIKPGQVPVSPTTLYKWHHLGKHPELFKKLSGFLFLDLEALGRLLEAGEEPPRKGRRARRRKP